MLESLLKKYWGYSSFRPRQREIILSVLQGKDTLALLPTGGGKSICYQLPAISKEGVCIVFSPLIALMQDQVTQLKERDIPAVALHSGLSKHEIDTELQNAVNYKYKLLYLSPERAATLHFKEYLKHLDVSFLVVDEAHCISQWGHSFRPEYLRIGELRELLPDAAVMALTATATSAVVKDIQKYLQFPSDSALFRSSFQRENLSYLLLRAKNKKNKIHTLFKQLQGSGLVYCNTRRQCEEMAAYLSQQGHNAKHYHAGLEASEREEIQSKWINNTFRIVCCTNAFGMGIDKPDVRLVVHLEAPDSPEAYYQEAGRAGRDGLKAYCILVDDGHRQELSERYPTTEELKRILNALYNHHQLAFNTGKDASYPIDVIHFAELFKWHPKLLLLSFRILNTQGFIKFNEYQYQPSKIKVLLTQSELYAYQVKHPMHDAVIKALLRNYSGLFDHYTVVDLYRISSQLKLPHSRLLQLLQQMQTESVLELQEERRGSYITYLKARPSIIELQKKHYLELRERDEYRAEYMLKYTENRMQCREKLLLKYFEEEVEENCGKCDICRAQARSNTGKKQFSKWVTEIEQAAKKGASVDELIELLGQGQKNSILKVLKWMMDQEYIEQEGSKLIWLN